MQLSKNKKFQYLFFLIILINTLFNGGNSNLIIQSNFIFTSSFFLFCLRDKNYFAHYKSFTTINKLPLTIYFIFLIYLIFQILPMPLEFLKLFSPHKYNYLKNLNLELSFSTISLSPSNSFFQFLNYVSLILIVLIFKMLFYTHRHEMRLCLFLSILGFISSVAALVFYLNGNPDFYMFKNSFYRNSSTGFFINRTVFSIFLIFCLLSSLMYLKDLNSEKKEIFFLKIYVRLFIVFITIGIITSFSRIGNFLFILVLLIYLLDEVFVSKKKDKVFRNLIFLIIIFDVVILGFYFGASDLLNRFYLLNEEFAAIPTETDGLKRFEIIKFGLNQIKNYLFFGYGSGSFETLYQLNSTGKGSLFANHAHSDLVQYFGELGLIGFLLLNLSYVKFFFRRQFFVLKNSILLILLIIILLFDFSLHIPIIQILFLIFFIKNLKIN